MSSDRIRLSVDEARALGERALAGIGYDGEEARIIADHVIDAALCGYEYSGLAKILNIPEHRRFAQPRRPIKILHETEVSALYDGGNNNGMVAMYHAARATIAKAAAHGIAIVGVTDSWMSGRSAYFVEMIARADLVAIYTASSGAAVAPHCGARPLLGGAALVPGHDDGYVFIAFRPDLLVPLADLKRELAALIARVKAVPPLPGFAEIRIPGEQSAKNRERLLREGLEIDRLVYDRLTALAG